LQVSFINTWYSVTFELTLGAEIKDITTIN